MDPVAMYNNEEFVDWFTTGGAVYVEGGPGHPALIDTAPIKQTKRPRTPVKPDELARLMSLAPNPNNYKVILYCKTHDRVTWWPSQGLAKEQGNKRCDQC
jgi:hypothetical protein